MMINSRQLIKDLSILGRAFENASHESGPGREGRSDHYDILAEATDRAFQNNPWFIPSFVRFAFAAWAEALQTEKIEKWIGGYEEVCPGEKDPAVVSLIMAGNIPMVGLHDLLCVLASGNRALIKLASSDQVLIPAVLKVLSRINPEYESMVSFAEGLLKNFDAVIATGSNNSSRYFEYYFGRYPHIIRKNRNGIAVITGQETRQELENLADDIFIYFGLGCRNVSKLYLPEGYDPGQLFPYFGKYEFFSDLHKYRNNYDYQKSILLINRIPHLDNGFLLIKPDHSMISPISVIHTEDYHSMEMLNNLLHSKKDEIQCVISAGGFIDKAISAGKSQFPELWDYADGADIMDFLVNLRKNH